MAYYNKGYALISLQKYPEAIDCFDKAISLDSRNPYAWNYKGYALFDLGLYEEAIKCFEKAIEADQENAYAWCGKGYVLFKKAEYRKAIDCFDKAISLDSRNPYAWNYKGLYYAWNYKGLAFANMKNKEFEEYKEEKNDRAILEVSRSSTTSICGGKESESLSVNERSVDRERRSQAIQCFNQAKKILEDNNDFDDSAFACRNKGYVHGKFEEYQDARSCYDEAIRSFKNKNNRTKSERRSWLMLIETKLLF